MPDKTEVPMRDALYIIGLVALGLLDVILAMGM